MSHPPPDSGGGPAPVVHLIDDDASVRRALGRILVAEGYAVEGHESAEAFLRRADPAGPGCLVVDLQLPGASGLEFQAGLIERGETAPLIFVTGRGDIPASVRAMKGGAVDFLTKPVDRAALLGAVASALERDRARQAARASEVRVEERLARLTPREREVLELVVLGRLNKQIAAELGIAEKTIKVHRARVMGKLEVRTLADLVRLMFGRRL